MRYAFGSAGWMAFMHGMIAERAARLQLEAPDIAWSICEVFTDPPVELSGDGSPLAWHCIVRDGTVAFEATETDAAAFKVVVDYAAVLPLGRYDTQGSPERAAELSRMSQALMQSGQMRVIGDRASRDPRIGDFHDRIAQVTA